jgi:Secretion system C-terminal sorting domain
MKDIRMYPNPTSGIFNITLPASNNEVEIEIFNIASQLLLRKTYKIVDGKVNLNISHFSQGIYVARLKSGSKKQIFLKIIKQ